MARASLGLFVGLLVAVAAQAPVINVGRHSFSHATITVTMQLDQAGKAWCRGVPAPAADPTAVQVRSGSGGGVEGSCAMVSFAAADTPGDVTITDLRANVEYNVYCVAESIGPPQVLVTDAAAAATSHSVTTGPAWIKAVPPVFVVELEPSNDPHAAVPARGDTFYATGGAWAAKLLRAGIAVRFGDANAPRVDSSNEVAEQASNCEWDGALKDWEGTPVSSPSQPLTASGSTDAEKDSSCCELCGAAADCEFWVRDTSSTDCWLMRDWSGFNHAVTDRRGNWRLPRYDTIALSADLSGTAFGDLTYVALNSAYGHGAIVGDYVWVRSVGTPQAVTLTTYTDAGCSASPLSYATPKLGSWCASNVEGSLSWSSSVSTDYDAERGGYRPQISIYESGDCSGTAVAEAIVTCDDGASCTHHPNSSSTPLATHQYWKIHCQGCKERSALSQECKEQRGEMWQWTCDKQDGTGTVPTCDAAASGAAVVDNINYETAACLEVC